ncbi:hypothetical protein A1O3_02939 [Capronia epimyces CBS 606.96]|uniref:Uncharacterized protein n=1 Tax=Capronia epimyces CBS 606.96 TaxID=1182542 RepID=W9YAM3_9EURO|nr:uncharacterized protein A1O3_02939 [Capronia epimyces CBS 606.96]EXJ89872.1 hypothetical protein A1O3_02939 [Capronia epimyces CBS 606.96]
MNALTTTRFLRQAGRCTRGSQLQLQLRAVSTLSNNSHIFVFQDPDAPSAHLLSLLPSDPPTPSLAIGTTTKLPPTPASFTENPKFLPILHAVMAENAASDPAVQAQAAVMISASGTSLFQAARRQRGDTNASASAARGGWVHVSDGRRAPEYGRIAEPEDIFGSVEVDGDGTFVDGHGRYQPSGTYRICTNDGILGLTEFMRDRLVQRLKVQESAEKNHKT